MPHHPPAAMKSLRRIRSRVGKGSSTRLSLITPRMMSTSGGRTRMVSRAETVDRHQDHEGRVDQRRLGLAHDPLAGVVFHGEQPQRLGDRPPHLPDAHHAEEVMVERAGFAAHRVGQALPPPHRELESPDHRPERRPLVLPSEALHRPVQVDPGVEIGGELPAEVHEVLEGDAAEAPLVPPRLPDGGGRLRRGPSRHGRLHRVREHLVRRFHGRALVDAHPVGPRGARGSPPGARSAFLDQSISSG